MLSSLLGWLNLFSTVVWKIFYEITEYVKTYPHDADKQMFAKTRFRALRGFEQEIGSEKALRVRNVFMNFYELSSSMLYTACDLSTPPLRLIADFPPIRTGKLWENCSQISEVDFCSGTRRQACERESQNACR